MCVDFIKGKCSRETCKYFHPPEHLVSQLKKQKITNNAQVAALNAALSFNNCLVQPSGFSSYLGVNPVQYSSPYRLNTRTNPKNINVIPTKFNYQPSTPLPNNNLRNLADSSLLHNFQTTNSNSTIHIPAALASNTANAATATLVGHTHIFKK